MAFGKIIQTLVLNSVKSSVNFDLAIVSIIERFKESCPLEKELEKIIIQKNSLSQALSQTQSVLTSVTTTTDTLSNIISTINVGINTIRLLPIPSAVPPGIGLPMNVINGFSFLLDTLGDLIKNNNGTLNQVTPAIEIIKSNINSMILKLNELDILIVNCYEEKTTGMTDSEKQEFFLNLGIDLDSELKLYQNYNLQDNLSSNSKDPYYYKGFKLVLENNKQNQFSFPLRRITAYNKFLKKKIVGPWSYSSSVQVLIDTIKFEIDKFLFYNVDEIELGLTSAEFSNPNSTNNPPQIGSKKTIQDKLKKLKENNKPNLQDKIENIKQTTKTQYAPFGYPGIDQEVKTYRTGNVDNFYIFSAKDKKWNTPYSPNLSPINSKGNYDKEIRSITNQFEQTISFYEWQKTYYKWVFLKKENI